MARIKLARLGDEIQRRLERRLDQYQVGSPEFTRLLTTLAMRLEMETKLNVRREGIIDTGRLFNSIQAKIRQSTNTASVQVGSFGVPYARIHEFGKSDMGPRQRAAMFARLREEGKIGKPGKGVIFARSFRARPYLRPAFRKVIGNIDRLLRDLIR